MLAAKQIFNRAKCKFANNKQQKHTIVTVKITSTIKSQLEFGG